MIVQTNSPINCLGDTLSAAYRNKEAIQDVCFRATNAESDNFPELCARAGNVDRWGHLGRWIKQNFGPSNRGYSEFDSYLLFPLLIIEEISTIEMLRMLPLVRRFYPTTRELLAFQIENKKIVNRLLIKHRYRIIALGADDFDQAGFSPAFIRAAGSSIVFDRIADRQAQKWGPKCLILLRYPRRSL